MWRSQLSVVTYLGRNVNSFQQLLSQTLVSLPPPLPPSSQSLSPSPLLSLPSPLPPSLNSLPFLASISFSSLLISFLSFTFKKEPVHNNTITQCSVTLSILSILWNMQSRIFFLPCLSLCCEICGSHLPHLYMGIGPSQPCQITYCLRVSKVHLDSSGLLTISCGRFILYLTRHSLSPSVSTSWTPTV